MCFTKIYGDIIGNRQLAGDLVGNAPIRSPLLFWYFPKGIRYSVSIAEKVSNTLLAFPKE